ncbi:MAG: hypothetical protein GKC03_09385, partial [Methanomassiliicoccales archaeon]|nr:hypothetical protein [Methanomassiliicoccales archaeon]
MNKSSKHVLRLAAILIIAVALTSSIFIFASMSANVQSEGELEPIVWTDKMDYLPGETVIVSGSGFEPNGDYDLPVIRPDGTMVIGDGSFTPGWDTVKADVNGDLIYHYQLDGIAGTYEVRAYDSPWQGDLTQAPITSTTFTDKQASASISQFENGAASAPSSNWITGNLNKNNAHYIEGHSVPYRCVMDDLPTNGTVITLQLGFDIKHSDAHAIDFLTNYTRMDNPSHMDAFGHAAETPNPLDGVTGVSTTISYFTIPAPTSISSPVPGQPTQSYNDIVSVEGIEAVQMVLFGGTITAIEYGPQADLTAAQDEQLINVTFTVDSNNAVLAWGGHIASRSDWGYDVDGDPLSAGGIKGAPYHMRLKDWNLGNLGNQDLSLSAAAAYAPSYDPVLLTTKIGPSSAMIGETIVYDVTVQHDSSSDGSAVFNVTVVDSLIGSIVAMVDIDPADGYNDGDTNKDNALNETEIWLYTVTYTVQIGDPDPLINTVNATGNDTFGDEVWDEDSESVDILRTDISITKEGPASALVGETVTYYINVTNDGEVDLYFTSFE